MGSCTFGFGIRIVGRRSEGSYLVNRWCCFFVGSHVLVSEQRRALRHAPGAETLEAAWPEARQT